MKRQVRLGEDVQKAVLSDKICMQGLPWQLSGKEPTYQRRGLGFSRWSGIPRALEQLSPCPQPLNPGSRAEGGSY